VDYSSPRPSPASSLTLLHRVEKGTKDPSPALLERDWVR